MSCSDDKEEIFVQDATLSGLTTSSISVGNVGGSETFSVNCAVMPSAIPDAEWIIVNRVSSANKVHTFSVNVIENTENEPRIGHVTVSAGNNTATITVNQEAAPVKQDPVEEADAPLLGINAADIAKDFKMGWNIGNTLEAIGAETAWGNPKINEAYVAGIKAAGFNAVRIPCSWDNYIIDKTNYTIDPAWLDRVNEVVGYVIAQDMYALLNIHWDGGWLENNIGTASTPELIAKQKALWSQIATRLGHYNEKLLFLGLNEPNAGNEWGNKNDNILAMKALLDYEQAFVDAVRSVGGNNTKRTLVVQAPHTSIDMAVDYMTELPKDPSGEGYMMVEVHYYGPSDYTIMEKDGEWADYVKFFWGKQFHRGGKRDCTWGEEDYMLAELQKMQKNFVNKGIPVILGEYGAYPEEHIKPNNVEFTDEELEIIRASREYWYKCFSKFAKDTGVMPFVWDTGELINRNNGEIRDGKQYIINAILNGADDVKYPN